MTFLLSVALIAIIYGFIIFLLKLWDNENIE